MAKTLPRNYRIGCVYEFLSIKILQVLHLFTQNTLYVNEIEAYLDKSFESNLSELLEASLSEPELVKILMGMLIDVSFLGDADSLIEKIVPIDHDSPFQLEMFQMPIMSRTFAMGNVLITKIAKRFYNSSLGNVSLIQKIHI